MHDGAHETGFYLSPQSATGAVHYVDPEHLIRLQDPNLGKSRLLPIPLGRLLDADTEPRANLQYASATFECAAIEALRRKDVVGACELLMQGVRHDALLARRSGKRPSTRIYDLLAGLAVRFDHSHYLDRLRELAAEPQAHSRLRERAAKWAAPNSTWRRRWRDTATKLVWHRPGSRGIAEAVEL